MTAPVTSSFSVVPAWSNIRYSSGGRRVGGVLGSPYRSPSETEYLECLPLVDTNVHPESGGPLFEEFTNCLFWQHTNGAGVVCDQGFLSPSKIGNCGSGSWVEKGRYPYRLKVEYGESSCPPTPLSRQRPRPCSSHLNLEARSAPPLASHFP